MNLKRELIYMGILYDKNMKKWKSNSSGGYFKISEKFSRILFLGNTGLFFIKMKRWKKSEIIDVSYGKIINTLFLL